MFPNELAKNLGYENLTEYLRSDEWKSRRISLFDERCYCCGRTKGLSLYHLTYIRLGNELESDVVTTCGQCSIKLRKLKDKVGQEIAPNWLRNELRTAKKKKKLKFDFVPLIEIAHLIKNETISSLVILLTEHDLVKNSQPTQKAFDEGWVKRKNNKFYWNEKMVKSFVKTHRT